MTIWFPVMLNDELDMLEMKLAETALYPARHVIVEAEVTHRGVPKPLHYAEITERFGAYADRIDYVIAKLDGIEQPWAREHAQRDAAWPVIDENAADDDLVVITDADEFPSPYALAWKGRGAVALWMKTTLFAVDWLIPDSQPLPPTTVMANAGWLRKMRRLSGMTLGDVRDRRGTYRLITDGGWHFSWTGGPEAQRRKLEDATCHTELQGTDEGELIYYGERYRTDRHGEGHLPVIPVDVDASWPAWIRDRKCPDLWFRPREEPAPPLPQSSGMTVMLTCWRRPPYFEATLRSWAKAAAVCPPERIVVALGRTDKASDNLEIIKSAASWCPVPVEVAWQSADAEASPGPHRAIGEAAHRIFAESPGTFLVFGEEDVMVSDDVLAYMDWARHELDASKRVLSAVAHNCHGSGWNDPGDGQDEDADQQAVRLLRYFSPWVWGTWQDRWEQVLEPNWDWDCNSGGVMDSGYDWNIQRRIMPRYDMTCAVPDASRSQNIGQHGGWSESSAPEFTTLQTATFRQHRDETKYRLES